MNEDKVYTPEVTQDVPFPSQTSEVASTSSEGGTGGNYSPSKQTDTPFLTRKIAVELIGSALNTRSRKILQEFELVTSGGFQVGKYENGISGDLRITPGGLTARDSAGLTTFAIDGDTGDAVFKGEVQAGSFVSGLVIVGDNSVVIDGESKRLVFYDESGVPVIVIGNA